MPGNNCKQKETTIAITYEKTGEWQFFTFPTWEEARLAVNAARREGKAAVFYDGATLAEPPESSMPPEPPKD
ncbi:hypothetical protein [Iningainema tapete]|uniref:Uncharacterized protein n=1 Tax=Iningainema tapete BLCC-T55 TaxID=2748662 RepID=A0A8J6XJ19_9CYAN|nr:hypothetical protein [Iningainema tapete]MBD2771666.1 hypothetical protein [Iningainema tapete BLCC-T55]